MSQPATERRPAARPSAGGGSGLSKKIGPLPTWAWFAIALGGGVVWYLWRQHQASASTAASGTGTTTAPATQADIVALSDEVNVLARELSLFTPPGPPPTAPPGGRSPCPPDMTWNDELKKCVDDEGKKPKTCPDGWAWDADAKRCVPEDVKGKHKVKGNEDNEMPARTTSSDASVIAAASTPATTVTTTTVNGATNTTGAGSPTGEPAPTGTPLASSGSSSGGGTGIQPAALSLNRVGTTNWQQAVANTPPPVSGPPQQIGGGTISGKRII